MGMFDSVMVPCPKCGTEMEFQTKGGECLLLRYTLENAPEDAMSDVNRLAPTECECGSWVEIQDVGGKPAAVQVGRPVAEEQGKIPYRFRKGTSQ